MTGIQMAINNYKNIREFIAILILIFSLQVSTKADDIRDFEIEGISVGESLLNFFDKNFIDELKYFNYDSNEMYSLYIKDNLNTYEEIEINFKNNDDNYIVQAIAGIEVINVSECLKKKKIITNELKPLFNLDPEEWVHTYDNDYLTSGTNVTISSESTAYISEWKFSNGDMVRIWCSNWGDDVIRELNWNNELHVKIQNKNWMDFLLKQ